MTRVRELTVLLALGRERNTKRQRSRGRRTMLGRTIKSKNGQYKLIDVHGSGSMATVYVSRDLGSNRIFAIKVLRPEIANQGEFLERFHREAQILMVLTDPHIVRPVEYGDDG